MRELTQEEVIAAAAEQAVDAAIAATPRGGRKKGSGEERGRAAGMRR
jgi:hypothetical protein